MSISDFEILKTLGKGSFATVYKVKRWTDGQIYAMKVVKYEEMNPRDQQNTLNEIRILASIDHPNIISYKEAFIHHSNLCIVMEYAEKGDLTRVIKKQQEKNTLLREVHIWNIFGQILTGLNLLHSMGILHRDIKLANIFLSSENVVKLGDLNISTINMLARTRTGTPYYTSPEIWKDCPYDARSDVWSLGCTIYELSTKLPPFRADSMKGIYRKIIMGKYQEIPQCYSKDLKMAIRAMLQTRPSNRPQVAELLEMPIIVRNLTKKPPRESLNESLLETIRVPSEFRSLKNRLPGPCYQRSLSEVRSSDRIVSKSSSKESLRPSFTPNPSIRISERIHRRGNSNIFKERVLKEIYPNIQVKLPKVIC